MHVAVRITMLPEIFHMKTSTENGFSLIEVLVAVFVLAVGVIGAAGMQLAALRTAQQSSFQTHALHLATEMADYMRANVGQMRRIDAVNPYLRVDYRASGVAASPASSVNCYGIDAQCDEDELAQFEIAEWLRRLAAALPGARTRICRDAAPWDKGGQRFRWECTAAQGHAIASIVIKIGWRERHADGRLLHEDGSDAPGIALLVAPYVE
ncbi:hypothetical protein GCM10011430_15320 [Oxalicibacterium solurbis]|uniref:Type IV pilus modification protein PilV n=2 Tax=Oxalicibacterium solurbis TaxID=69280 RepID=A0A8J3F634_9BURK|nr:hypothetical protein GCM10011430_15320 [Oxalicibacterium solurbis]